MVIKIQFNKSKDAKTKVRPIRKLQTKIKIRKLAETLPSSCKARVWKYLHRNLYVLKRNFWVAIKQGREYIMLFYLNIFACSGRCALGVLTLKYIQIKIFSWFTFYHLKWDRKIFGVNVLERLLKLSRSNSFSMQCYSSVQSIFHK